MSQLGRVPALGRGISSIIQKNLPKPSLIRVPPSPLLPLIDSRNQVRLASGCNSLASKIPHSPSFEIAVRRRDSVKAWKIFSDIYEHNLTESLPSKQVALLLRLIRKGKDPNTAERCQRIIAYIERNDITLTSMTEYGALALYHASRGDIKRVEETLQQMLQRRLTPTSDLYIELITSLSRNSPSLSFQLYQLLHQEGILSDTAMCNTLMKIASKHEEFNRVFSIHSDMKKFQILPNDETYSLLLHTCSKVANIEQAKEIYKEMMDQNIVPDVTSFSILIDLLISWGSLEQATGVYNDMIRLGHSPNIWTYSILIKGYTRSSRLKEAVLILEEMAKRGVTPNVVTYSTLIQGFVRVQDYDKATEYFERMLTEGILPNERTYSILIGAFAKEANIDKSLELYQDMLSRKITPDTITLNSLIHACSKSHNMQQANQIFEEMQKRRLKPDVVTFTTLIDGYVKIGDLDEAFKAFELMKTHQISPNVKTYTALINGFGKYSSMDKALVLFEEMKTAGLRPNSLTYNSLIDGYMKSARLDRAVDMFEQMKKSDVPLITSTYNIMMNGCLTNSKLEQVLLFYHEMTEKRLPYDVFTYGILMNFHSFKGDGAKTFELWNIARKTFPSEQLTSHASILLDSCGVNGDLETLKGVWSNLKNEHFPLSENNFNSYIEALCKFQSFIEAKRVFTTEMKEYGIKPNSKSLLTLLNQIKHRPLDTQEIIDLVRSEYPDILSTIQS